MLWNRAWVFPFTGSLEALDQKTLAERHGALRQLLKEKGIDAALINLDAMRGGSRWFFNEPSVGANEEGYALMVPEQETGAGKERARQHVSPTVQQVGEVLHINAGEARSFDFAGTLGTCRRIGTAFAGEMNAGAWAHFSSNLAGKELVDITEEYVACRTLRNADDLEHAERSALQHDRIMQAAQTALRPGQTEPEALAGLKMVAYRNGGAGFSTLYFAGAALVSAQPGEKVSLNGIPSPGREIRLGDRICLRMKCVGISGYYGDISRLFVLGRPDAETEACWRSALRIQEEIAREARPGRTVAELKRVMEAAADRAGAGARRPDFLCGSGPGPEEGPNDAFDRIPLREEMTVSIHPVIFDGCGFPYCAGDMYRITGDGAVRLTQTPQEIICL